MSTIEIEPGAMIAEQEPSVETWMKEAAAKFIADAHDRINQRYPKRKMNEVSFEYFPSYETYQPAPGAAQERFLVMFPDEMHSILAGRPLEAGKALVRVAIRYRGVLPVVPPRAGWYAKSKSADGSQTWFFLGDTHTEAAQTYDMV
jgi:hypothetical protein